MKINTKYIYMISMVSAMGGLLFGYDWVVIGGAKPFYEQFFHISNNPSMQGWAMSSALLGCLVGAAMSGMLSDKYGRKLLLIISAFLFTLSAVGTGATSNFSIFIVYRIIGGIGIGLASNLSPMYIAEIAPANMRGRLVSLNQLTIVIGILAAQLVNWQLAEAVPEGFSSEEILNSWNGQTGWRYMFWAETIPAMFFFILMFLVPESPRWLAKNGTRSSVEGILTKIGGRDYASNEYENIIKSLNTDTNKVAVSMLNERKIRPILVLGVVLAVFQQWCGINVIFNYAEEIFKAAGFGVSDILFNIVITGAINLIFTFVAIYTVDKLGRRKLMLFGSLGLSIIYLLVGGAYYYNISGTILLILVLLAIATYAMSLAPIVWVIISEIFPNKIRGMAMAIATLALWSACFVLTYTFPLLNSTLGAAGTFWLYGAICFFGWVFVFRKLPETKGKSLEEIENEIIK
ncbi:sugar porter family MFS transporter [Siansivirga zeaxanthinifaciens]|uniref:MFS transporter n=1 Tax=Siansivirga zeaxanthinifaciens CC-SAMT-1 TaxID=1454006 RepID=A0A0C5VZM2_9FLAO|nr:sugar porter family MFS transporter [Siansivirga zeaxanthinifaciens]AJR04511.1 MFS transporter [Siansivirga zeaxanthinifaciens CC-SAMT-1]